MLCFLKMLFAETQVECEVPGRGGTSIVRYTRIAARMGNYFSATFTTYGLIFRKESLHMGSKIYITF